MKYSIDRIVIVACISVALVVNPVVSFRESGYSLPQYNSNILTMVDDIYNLKVYDVTALVVLLILGNFLLWTARKFPIHDLFVIIFNAIIVYMFLVLVMPWLIYLWWLVALFTYGFVNTLLADISRFRKEQSDISKFCKEQ